MPSINIENGKRIEDLLEINNFTTSAHFLVSEHNLTRKTTLLNLRYMFNGDIAINNLNNLYYSVEKINEIIDRIDDDFAKLTKRIDTINAKLEQIYNDLGDNLDEFKKRIENIYNELKQADQDLYTYINTQIKNEREARLSTDNQLNQNIIRERSERITGDENLEKKIKSISDGILERLAAVESGLKDETKYRTEADTDLTIRVSQLENTVNDVFKPKFRQVDKRLGDIESDISVKYGYLNNEIINLKNKISYGSSAPGYLAEGQIYLQYF